MIVLALQWNMAMWIGRNLCARDNAVRLPSGLYSQSCKAVLSCFTLVAKRVPIRRPCASIEVFLSPPLPFGSCIFLSLQATYSPKSSILGSSTFLVFILSLKGASLGLVLVSTSVHSNVCKCTAGLVVHTMSWSYCPVIPAPQLTKRR